MKGKPLWLWIVFLAFCSLLVYLADLHQLPFHATLRYILFVPVVLSCSTLGENGIVVSSLASMLYVPLAISQLGKEGLTPATLEIFATVFLLFISGWILGSISEKAIISERVYHSLHVLTVSGHEDILKKAAQNLSLIFHGATVGITELEEKLHQEEIWWDEKGGKLLYPLTGSLCLFLQKEPYSFFYPEEAELLKSVARHVKMEIRASRRLEQARALDHLLRTVLENLHFPTAVSDREGKIFYKNHLFAPYCLRNGQSENIRLVPQAMENVSEALREKRTVAFNEKRIIPFAVKDIFSGAVVIYENSGEHETLVTLSNKLQVKQDFLSVLSHELRTPLTSIRGFALTLLRHPELSREEEREFNEIISEEIGRLKRFLISLNEAHRIGKGDELSVYWRKANVADVVKKAVTVQKSLSQHHEFNFQIKQIPHVLFLDADRLFQILTNLLDNARKYSTGGRITVSVNCQHNLLQFVVEDEGKGLAEGEEQAVFQKYWRCLDKNGNVKGMGLGLYLSQKTIEIMGGKIWAERKDKGVRFCFEVPYYEEAPEGQGEAESCRQ